MPDSPPPSPPLLRSITLRGFKSFADKVTLNFDGGVCAIIGPNGSGKSNVVEALRWVTQQARARELRTQKATELIFHGSGMQGSGTQGGNAQGKGQGKAPLGLAEVELELRLETGSLSVSRRIYRDGTSEQDLGGRPARVRDIHAALRGTGLGPGGLAVIGQGEVSGVVQASGAALLGYLQEAAGLSRAVNARQETAQRLTQAQGSLNELSLLTTQADERATQLAAQAQAARQARDLELQVLSLQSALARARALSLEDEIAGLLSEAQTLEHESTALSERISAAQAQLASMREAQLLAQAQQESHAQQQKLIQAAKQQLEQQEKQLEQLRQEAQQLGHELSQLESQPSNQAPQTAPQDPTQHQRAVDHARTQIAGLEQHLEGQREQLRRLEAHWQQQREAQARSSAQQETWQESLSTLQAQFDERAAALAHAEQAAQEAREQHAQAAKALEEQQHQEREISVQRQHLQQTLSTLALSEQHLGREAQRLGQALDSYARYGEGPRRALSSEHAGIVGSVADLLEVSADYDVAVQAALGRRLEQVVVSTANDARELVEMLRRQGGRATFLPLDLLRPRPRRDQDFLHEAGVVGNLADLCPSDPPQVSQVLLSDTLLVQDLQAATALARRYAARPRLVTLEGDLLESGGAITGGRTRDNGPSVLADQRRYHELQDELSRLEQQKTQLSAKLAALPPEQAELSQQLRQAAKQQAERLSTLEQQLAQAQAAKSSILEQLGRVQQQLQAAQGNAGMDDNRPAPLAAISDLQAQIEHTQQELSAARDTERHEAQQLLLASESQHLWQLFEQAQMQRAALQVRLERNQHGQQAQQQSVQEAKHALQQLLESLPPAQPEQAIAHNASSDLPLQYSNLLAQQNKVSQKLEETRLHIARREGARQPIPDGCLPAGNVREWQTQLGQARRELEQLGAVNALAEQELAAAQEDLQALSTQRQDVQAACDELSTHLEQMAAQEAKATAQAFERTRRAFAEYAGELLGGVGDLEPEYTGDSPTSATLSGLSLMVQPKGKRTRNLNLLSAGERTMAGLAFLFALGHAAPSEDGTRSRLPLAVLDEVDAPLDEANIRRFTRFLELFAAQGSQFVLVTHQKATMEVAQAIWGVTTDQSGASKLLSIKQE